MFPGMMPGMPMVPGMMPGMPMMGMPGMMPGMGMPMMNPQMMQQMMQHMQGSNYFFVFRGFCQFASKNYVLDLIFIQISRFDLFL